MSNSFWCFTLTNRNILLFQELFSSTSKLNQQGWFCYWFLNLTSELWFPVLYLIKINHAISSFKGVSWGQNQRSKRGHLLSKFRSKWLPHPSWDFLVLTKFFWKHVDTEPCTLLWLVPQLHSSWWQGLAQM